MDLRHGGPQRVRGVAEAAFPRARFKYVLDEPITLGIAIGFPLVLAGSWLATRGGPPVEAEPHG